MPQLFSVPETSERLGVSKWTLAAWRKSGFGPPYIRLKGHEIRYSADALDAWIQGRMVNSLAEERGRGQEFPGSEVGGFK
jgi:predicted DNA-binding transcriptional regulator AlpA